MTASEIVPLTASEARELTDRIKVGAEAVWEMLKQAWRSRAWDALGYASWDDYCTREFGSLRLRIPREDRPEVVSSMREIGMSVRAVASATNHGVGTVHRALAAVPNGTPGPAQDNAPVDESDWYKPTTNELDALNRASSFPAPLREAMEDIEDEYDAPAPQVVHTSEPTPEPPRVTGTDGKSYAAKPAREPNRPALPPQFRTVSADLTRLIARVERLKADDRYRANKAAIADLCVPEIRRATEVLSDLLDDLGEDSGDQAD